MSQNQLQSQMMKSVLVGSLSVSLFVLYQYMMKESEISTSTMSKEQTINSVFTALKKELREFYPIDMPRDSKDGLIDKQFFVKMHSLIYKFKKYGQDMIEEANFCARIAILQEKDLIDQEKEAASAQDKERAQKLNQDYTAILKGEKEDMEQFTIHLQDIIFDYFNLIVKEYYMALDKWSADDDYVKQVKEEYAKIDKEVDEEELSVAIPEEFTKAMAEQLLTEKEGLLKNVYSQVMALQKQGQVDGQNFDLEQTVMLNKTMFDDKMYLRTNFSGKDLQRAIKKHGIYDQKIAAAKKMEQDRQDKLLEQFNKYLSQKKSEETKAGDEKKEGVNKQDSIKV